MMCTLSHRVLLAAAILAPMGAQAGCFTASDKPDIPIFQHAPPPSSDQDTGYAFYPVTVAVSQDLARVTTASTQVSPYAGIWSNHGPRSVVKGNFFGKEIASGVTINFSSNANADACTMARTRHVLGLDTPVSAVVPQVVKSRAFRGSSAVAATGALQIVAKAPAIGGSLVDICPLPQATTPQVAGLELDYEVHDGRTPAEAKAFLQAWIDLVHGAGKKALLYTNPLDSRVQLKSGLDAATVAWLPTVFDYTTVFVWRGNSGGESVASSLASQLKLLGSYDPSRIIISFQINDNSTSGLDNHVVGAGTTLDDAKVVRNAIMSKRLAGAMFWRNGASQGDPDCASSVNRKMACVAMGKC